MGDLFFVIKMGVYTFLLVILMQIKVGSTTIEQRVIEFTHHSTLAGHMQEVAEGAAHFFGVKYDWVLKKLKKPISDKISGENLTGQRLSNKLKEWKTTLNDQWKGHEKEPTEKKQEKQ